MVRDISSGCFHVTASLINMFFYCIKLIFSPVCRQREALSALRIAVERRGTMTTPATAQRTAWREETAAPTTSRSAKVLILLFLLSQQSGIENERGAWS